MKWLLPVFLGGWLTACVPVIRDWNPQDYTVKKGDTLYSIAWRYEKDYRDIARWNNIDAPYAIYPGQRLSMTPDDADGTIDHAEPEPVVVEEEPVVEAPPPEPVVEIDTPKPLPPQIVVEKGDTLYSLARRHDLKVVQIARWNFLKRPYRIHPGQTLRLRPPAVATISPPVREPGPVNKPPPPVAKLEPQLPARVRQWHWPVSGKVIKTFNRRDTSRKGIGIAGNRGEPVKAAADGQVVYSGNGLISYGNLVIIKHSNAFLSAYAYNKTLLVKEGEKVKAGQVIARMGTHDNGRALLHFEIRKNGKPVNPMRYLPQKRG